LNTDERFTVGLVVTNRHGVLYRIAGMYAKRCYNIDSLSVGETENPAFSRMTIVSTGDETIRRQVIRQLNKLYDVKIAVLLEADSSISVEHLLIKIKLNGRGNGAVVALINEYGGKIVELFPNALIADVTGTPAKVQDFIEKCKPLGIYELCRSGALTLSNGTKQILTFKKEGIESPEDML